MRGHTQRIDPRLADGATAAAVPKRIGKYEIVEPIGEGGFGMVYKGFDPFIKRPVAIKTCTSPDPELRQRYFREAEIAGRLDHPNIVRIFDFGIEDDTPFLVQELLAGRDLDDKIDGPDFIPFPERLLYLIHIARGLAFAHDQGVIHRDIKPANIRILEDGTAKIMDFGVAMLENSDTRLTREGLAVGTAAYLAPEQVRGQTPDNRSDIFSYGVLAYELLTGERPFVKETISATLYSILHDDPKPIRLPSERCPVALSELIARCLDKDETARPADMSVVLTELDGVRQAMQAMETSRDFASELHTTSSIGTPAAPPHRRIDPPLHGGWSPPSMRMHRRSRWRALLVPLVVLVSLISGYAALASQGMLPWPEVARGWVAGSAAPASGIQVSAPRRFSAAYLDRSAAVDDDLLAIPDAPPPSPAARPAGPAISSPVAGKAVVRLEAAWHPATTVSIDSGPPLRLDRARSFELTPGAYSLGFRLDTGDYRATRSVDLRLAAGERRRLTSPIARPGRLSVQASLGSPQGIVHLDGRRLAASPLRGHRLAPGLHQLQVYSLRDSTLPLAETTVDIRSGSETVVTFDLTGQRELAVRHRQPSS